MELIFCIGTGPCFDYEYHINGDIGLGLYNYYAVTGDEGTFRNEMFPVYDAIASFYSDLLTLNESTGQWELTNATDPVSFHVAQKSPALFTDQHF